MTSKEKELIFSGSLHGVDSARNFVKVGGSIMSPGINASPRGIKNVLAAENKHHL